jgi:membrane peptidoglycan carboxypeptidase
LDGLLDERMKGVVVFRGGVGHQVGQEAVSGRVQPGIAEHDIEDDRLRAGCGQPLDEPGVEMPVPRPVEFLIQLLVGFLVFLGGAALLYSIYNDVAEEAKEKIKGGAIDSIVFSESPVYYDDGETVLGVFFDKTHRRYIEYNSIPPYFVKALVATEDRTFFTHPGFDAKAIIRAMIANYRAGRIAQGGSTLTQQTAKNIFSREKKSYQAKLKELMEALLLERQYTKEQILEMYINQFFVTGIGRGLRIAAQYFFDKEAEDLDLVESAFIAGSIKSPNRFNPFIKRTEAEKREARRMSRQRKDQVLNSMLEMNFISAQEYEQAKEVMRQDGEKVFGGLPIFAYAGVVAPTAELVQLKGFTVKQGASR